MKVVFILLLVFSVTMVFAQFEEGSHLFKDPSVSSELYKTCTIFHVEKFQISPEIEFTQSQQNLKIPLSCPWKNFVFGAHIPIIRKTITYDDKSKSPIGIGDMSVTAAFRSYLKADIKGWQVDYAGNLTVKLPTGNKDKIVTINGVDSIAPMGSGSLDMIFSGNLLFKRGVYSELFTDIQFRLNGRNKDEAKLGNSLNIKGKYGFIQFEPKFDGYITILIFLNGDGDVNDPIGPDKIESSMFIIDIIPELHYLTSVGMAKVSITVPMITSADIKFTRDISVRFGLTKEF
ncbi:MAG: hypothetical protein KAS53_05800 [Candidatus Cloacimonetes bacterium]|nr:hypothetical protein [Candidatus Cloacimonadota bacterium]